MISVIMPFYKNKKNIKHAIDSVLKQSFSNWELILVDDFGNDGSIEIAKYFANRDKRIRIISHEKNRGVDQARFTGIKHCKGDYLFFIDADDYIYEKSLELLFNKIEEEHSDVVFGGFARVFGRFRFIKSKTKNNYTTQEFTDSIENPELFEKYFISFFGVNVLFVSMCGKLYRKETVVKANIKPSNAKMGEDLLFNLKLHPFLEKVSFITDLVYYYRFGGMTNTANPYFLKDIKDQYFIKKEYIKLYEYDKAIPFIKHELVNCFYSHLLNLKLFDKTSNSDLVKFIKNEVQDPIYCELTQDFLPTIKSAAIINKDENGIIDIMTTDLKRYRYIYKIKKLLSAFL